jgi:cell division protein FtsB
MNNLNLMARALWSSLMLVKLRPYLPIAAIILLIAYFAFHALVGEGGLLTWSQRTATLAKRTEQLATLRHERAELEARAQLLRDASLSRDLLEERARSLIGFSDPRDYVVRFAPSA